MSDVGAQNEASTPLQHPPRCPLCYDEGDFDYTRRINTMLKVVKVNSVMVFATIQQCHTYFKLKEINVAKVFDKDLDKYPDDFNELSVEAIFKLTLIAQEREYFTRQLAGEGSVAVISRHKKNCLDLMYTLNKNCCTALRQTTAVISSSSGDVGSIKLKDNTKHHRQQTVRFLQEIKNELGIVSRMIQESYKELDRVKKLL